MIIFAMNIYYDANMPYVPQFFSEQGKLIPFDGRSASAELIKNADVLLVRSVTEVTPALLANSPNLQFVGTATIGTNHIDSDFLKQRNIPFYSAPGCNANSVAEYVLSVLFTLTETAQVDLLAKRIGIVGGGNTGSAVAKKLAALGIEINICDPHLTSHPNADLVSFAELQAWSDILCFHVPLIKDGSHPTYHLMAEAEFAALRPEQMLINACRGEVFDNRALLAWKKAGANNLIALDVWENEPHILEELIDYVDIATVHIAGHSVIGKARGTQMLYQRFCEQFKQEEKYTLEQFISDCDFQAVTISGENTLLKNTNTFKFNVDVIQKLMRLVYDVRRDDAICRKTIKSQGFDQLRKQYPVRYECHLMTIQSLASLSPVLVQRLTEIGFNVSES